MYNRPGSPSFIAQLEATVAGGDLRILSLDASKLRSLAIGKVIHGSLGKVEAIGGVVDCKNVDGLAVVGDAVAGTALRGVPAGNSLVTTDARERRDVALVLPAESGNEAVGTVRAGQRVQGTAAVIVTSVVGDCICQYCDHSRSTLQSYQR